MHSYLVSLRISGESLNFEKITADIGIKPTQIRVKGQPRSAGGKSLWKQSIWEYEVRPSRGEYRQSLEDGLTEIVSKLGSRKEVLRHYQREFRVCLFCGHFSSSFDGGPTLSPETLKQLDDFGVELFLDTYLCHETSYE